MTPSPAAITGWTLEFDFVGNIYDIWDGTIVSHVGNHYKIQNVSWDATIAAGQSVNFGFNADWNGAVGGPTHYVLNGTAVSGADSPAASSASWPGRSLRRTCSA